MYFIQARFKNGFFDVLRREIKVFETFDEVVEYLDSINFLKCEYVGFKGSKSLQSKMRFYSYDFVNKQLYKGKVKGTRVYKIDGMNSCQLQYFVSQNTPMVRDIDE